MPSNAPSLFSRPWVLVTTGFIAAYSSYIIWSNWPLEDTSANLRRRGAVRARNHTRDRTRIWASSPSEPSLPFGLLNVDFEGLLVRFPNGPAPPTVVEIQEALNIPNSSAFDLTIKIQEAALKAIFAILIQPDESLSTEQLEASRDLRELVPLLRQPNIDELLAKIHMLCSGSWKFHQAAVARAFADICGLESLPMIPDDTERGLSETSADSDHQDDREPAQGVKSLVYNIAQEEAMRRLYVHTGIRCEQCGQYPILGVRWHCNNCPDFDLCSTCESHPMHPKTHLFTKIKVPLSYLGQNHQVSEPWYPGDSMTEWPALKSSLKRELATESGFDDLTIQVFYDQFECKANVHYPEDPMQIGLAVDRHAFNKVMTSPTWERPVEPSFLYDRMFNFYDTDNNGLIGFKEYILGMAYLRRTSKRTSMDRIFLGYDVDGDGYISRRDFLRMLSAKYAVQKNIVGDMIRAAEYDMVSYGAKVVHSSQPISAAFAQEDVPPGQTRAPTMKILDRFGENQVRPDAGPFNSAVLPDGLELPDSSLVSTVAHRYGVGTLPPSLAHTDTLPLEYLTEFTNNLNRSDSVAVDGVETEGVHRYMVETDSRRTRGQTTLEDPEKRWHQDLMDMAQGMIPAAQNSDQGACTVEGDLIPDLSEDILERGRAYDVPVAEKDFGTEVIFQVVQEGLNELIDPIFAKKEKLAERVRKTREERRRFRKEIDEYVQEANAHRKELSVGSEVDPLMAIANAANDQAHFDIEEEHDEVDLGNTLLHVESTDEIEGLPTPREIAMDLQEHIAQQSETLNDDLEDLETNIREQSLDDLLAQSGYIIDSSSDVDPSSTTQLDSPRPDSPSTSLAEEPRLSREIENDARLDDMFSDMPELEDMPSSESNNSPNAASSTNSDSLSPSTNHLQAPFSTPNTDLTSAVFPPFAHRQSEKMGQSGIPSRERLKELARLDEEEKEIVLRGGGGRLNLQEFEKIIRSDKKGLLKGVVEGWLEWAEF